ncbi:MAG: TraB/VirB10 family protein [Deltaproteobacteria bacterium]|nr:TraB/VirB10 family protein [Deltaproteobacteria bacterium]
MIEKTMIKEQGRQIDNLKKNMNDLTKSQTDFLALEEKKSKEEESRKIVLPTPEQLSQGKPVPVPVLDAKGNQVLSEQGKPMFDTNPSPSTSGRNLGPSPQGGGGGRGGQKQEKKIVGKIAVVSNQAAIPQDDGKKKGRTVYLPPSFMEANLLTGFDAATSGGAKGGNSEPLLLRIQTPAVLPNDIKANLSGCFVIAEAVGRLDKERADVRLVSLSCLSNEGNAVIDTPIKGFVTDSDSKVGLSGRVVSRMGASTARAIIAGFFGGAGEALKAAATTTSSSVLGTTNTVDASQIGKYAVGGGLSEGANTLQDFYMDLAKQTTPVIEVAATKKITVIVSEGKDLEIKDNKRDESL